MKQASRAKTLPTADKKSTPTKESSEIRNSDLAHIVEEILDPEAPPEKRDLVLSLIQRYISYSGPIPPASEFAKYEETLPGSGNRIISMAEVSLEHSINIESRSLSAETWLSALGQILGFLAFVGVVAAGVFLVQAGNVGSGVAIAVVGSLSALASQIIKGRSVLFGRSTSGPSGASAAQRKNTKTKHPERNGR